MDRSALVRAMAICAGAFICIMASIPGAAKAVLRAGPNQTYKTPCAAIAAASEGDVILIDPALYLNDSCAWRTNGLVIIGILGPNGQRPHIDDSGMTGENGQPHLAQYKGIFVPSGTDTVIANMEFSNASIPNDYGANGAGIRQDGVNLTVLNCYFHDNQNGILESNVAGSNIVIKFSEFNRNGVSDPALTEGYGQTHNVYVGHAGSLYFAFNYSHDANVGHLLKSRAAMNYVLYNRLTGENGTNSFELDLPNGGTSYVIGNLIEKGPNSQNKSISMAYMEEGPNSLNPGTDLYVVNNDFVNQNPNALTFVYIGSTDTTPALVQNNIFYGPGTVTGQSNAILETNFTGDPLFVNLANYDYRLTAGSPAIHAGSQPRAANGFDLAPKYKYVHPARGRRRHPVGIIDIGAYEFGDGGPILRGR
jgi:hypothetical protein